MGTPRHPKVRRRIVTGVTADLCKTAIPVCSFASLRPPSACRRSRSLNFAPPVGPEAKATHCSFPSASPKWGMIDLGIRP
jgi:hypothetical protein